jgi:hypothetical protein
MNRSEIVIRIEMYKFRIRGRTMTMMASLSRKLISRLNCEWLFRSCLCSGSIEETSHATRRALCICFFLDAFVKLRNASVISVLPYVRVEQLGSHWTDFNEILYLNTFRKCIQKIRVSLK